MIPSVSSLSGCVQGLAVAAPGFTTYMVLAPMLPIMNSAIRDRSNTFRINLLAGNAEFGRCCRVGARRGLMAETPDIGRKRRRLSVGELCAAHRRHRAAVLLGFRNAVGNDFQNSGETSVAPQPFLFREIGTQRRAGAVRTVATGATRSAHLTMVDAIAQRNHVGR